MNRIVVFAMIFVVSRGGFAFGAAPDGLAARFWNITETVLERHVDPPSRSSMILGGLNGLRGASVTIPTEGLEKRAASVTSREQLAALLDEHWPGLPEGSPNASPNSSATLEKSFLDGALMAVPGGARLVSAKDARVEEQVAGNRYVGLQIALGIDREQKRPSISQVIEGGPANLAGVKKGDLIDEIDGVSTARMELKEAVDRLRGPENSTVTVLIRAPKSTQSRTLTIPRRVLPRRTVKGFREEDEGASALLIPGPERIGYLKFEQILGSTPRELRAPARLLEDEGARALILDLRPLGKGPVDLHSTVLTADALLEKGTIGRIRGRDRLETFRAEPDALFREIPLILLVDNRSPALVLWLAVALQDNGRAIVVGQSKAGFRPPGSPPSRKASNRPDGVDDVRSLAAVGDGSELIEMITGKLERGDGRPFGGKGGPLMPDLTAGPADFQDDPSPETDPVVRNDAILTRAVRRLREMLR